MRKVVLTDEERDAMTAESEWFDYIGDQILTVGVLVASALTQIQSINDDDDFPDFEPSADAQLQAAVEICKIVFAQNEILK